MCDDNKMIDIVDSREVGTAVHLLVPQPALGSVPQSIPRGKIVLYIIELLIIAYTTSSILQPNAII